jgi:hypothetical protein
VVTTDPATLPALATWYLLTNLPSRRRPGGPAPADLAEVVRLYGLRMRVEQDYKQVKQQLGWADFQVRSDRAIRRHFVLVCCAFSFCWHATHGVADPLPPDQPPARQPMPKQRVPDPPPDPVASQAAPGRPGGRAGGPIGPHPARWTPAATWPVALRRVRAWLTPWLLLQRCWRAWSTSPPVQAMLDWVAAGRPLYLYLPP